MFSCGPDQTQVRRQFEASCRALAAVAGQREPRDSSTWKSLIRGLDISQSSQSNSSTQESAHNELQAQN